jgi:hypothetical protein
MCGYRDSKKKALCALVTAVCVGASSCAIGGITPDALAEGEFWAWNTDSDEVYKVTALKIGEGTRCIVYAEEGSKLQAAHGARIADEYDANIYPLITNAFGTVMDVDRNGKVTLLLLDIKERPGSPGSVGGYFHPINMMKRGSSYPYSNEADMLYIDINPQTPLTEEFYATIAHELQHLIHYSQTVALAKPRKDTWINEGLSTGAEYLYKGDPNKRLGYLISINNSPFASPNAVKDNFFVWNGSLEDYATGFLFFQWIRVNSKNDTMIYKQVLNNTAGNYQSVLDAAKGAFYDNTMTSSWESFLASWHIANYKPQISSYGYQNDALITKTLATYNRTSFCTVCANLSGQPALRPGEAIITKVNSATTFTPSQAASIRYIKLADQPDFNRLSFTQNDVILLFNANANNAGTTQLAEIPVASMIPFGLRALSAPALLAEDGAPPDIEQPPMMIDVRFGLDGKRELDAP